MLVRISKSLLLFCACSICSPIYSWAQEPAPTPRSAFKERSEQQIEALSEGVLIVRLPSGQKKISALETYAGQSGLKDKERKKIKEELAGTLSEKDSLTFQMMRSFAAYYRFSEVVFMYDTASLSLKKGARKGFLLDEKGKVDPLRTLPDKPFFVLSRGRTSLSTSSGVLAWIVMDEQLNELKDPFPYSVSITSLPFKLRTRVKKEKEDGSYKTETVVLRLKGTDKIAARLNKRLHNYLQKVKGESF